MTTLLKTTYEPEYRVTDMLREGNEWALTHSKAYRKWDGTACAIINSVLYKRYDAKIKKDGTRKVPPANSIKCQEPDPVTGHQPYWTPVLYTDNGSKRMLDAFNGQPDGTYEFCGPKVGTNPEGLDVHTLVPHTKEELIITDYSYNGLKSYLEKNDIEGIVFWSTKDNTKCKIRKTDFGLKR